MSGVVEYRLVAAVFAIVSRAAVAVAVAVVVVVVVVAVRLSRECLWRTKGRRRAPLCVALCQLDWIRGIW